MLLVHTRGSGPSAGRRGEGSLYCGVASSRSSRRAPLATCRGRGRSRPTSPNTSAASHGGMSTLSSSEPGGLGGVDRRVGGPSAAIQRPQVPSADSGWLARGLWALGARNTSTAAQNSGARYEVHTVAVCVWLPGTTTSSATGPSSRVRSHLTSLTSSNSARPRATAARAAARCSGLRLANASRMVSAASLDPLPAAASAPLGIASRSAFPSSDRSAARSGWMSTIIASPIAAPKSCCNHSVRREALTSRIAASSCSPTKSVGGSRRLNHSCSMRRCI
mmetsp:Transcript_12543/g.38314  ORF Transcript_12543/g.38314 Transcript_12543/m.38314 type:complete len:278 (-) Transcript_12543:3029-3862(-)